mmetsp:Transcript_33868/g.39403  ORF Transcript_33868/g.39403 Transcript_33868/m.39403 type:complete len:502 (+) Transcript_33868:33-1538(+)|eukprot:CAMPEP_0176423638 /NCGR_PEP_ID=MMETSP0127-20121128/10395_1 /TAXON_ID=938130 /ORGANISM="Platyophrya macrostoma, Strain WH" /LENGTH=501 /DNA_ID=CAMNT_0017804611 /DNA_START=32 /DNA_END=1537 /DNA_ORIENTATION=+
MSEPFKQLEQKRLPKKILSENKEAKYWKKYRTIYEGNENSSISFLSCSNKKKLFAFGTGNIVKLYDAKKETIKGEMNKFSSELVTGGCLRADGKLLATGEVNGTVQVFDIKRKFALRQYKKHTKAVHAIAFLDFSTLISAGDDLSLRLFDISTNEVTRTFPKLHVDYIRSVCPLPNDPNLMISSSYDGTLKLIDVRDDSKYVREWKHDSPVEAHRPFPDGSKFVSVGGTLTKFWDIGSERNAFTLNNNLKTVTCVNVLMGGEKVITGSVDEHLKIYSVKDNYKVIHQIKCFESLLGMDFTLDETHLALGSSQGEVQVFYKKHTKEIDEEEKANEFALDLQERKPFVRDYKFFNRGIYDEPQKFDVEFDAGKKKRLQDYERSLKKFQYKEALDKALKSGKKGVILSMIEELVQRDALDICLRNRTEEEYLPLFVFVEKNLAEPSQLNLLVDLAGTCLDVAATTLLQTDKGKKALRSLSDKLSELLTDQQNMLSVLGQLEMLE